MVKDLMLVDDDEDDRWFFLQVIESFFPDVQCTVAKNGLEALNKLVAQQYKPQLIFLDLNMPLMNGEEFLVEIKKHKNLTKIPVVVLTTSSDQETISRTTELGARDFITKPDKLTAWEVTLKKVFNNPALKG